MSLIPRVIPVLLLDKHGGLTKTVQFKDRKYVGDPINAIRIFNEKEVDEILVLDIDATRERRPPNFEMIRDFASECFMPLCYGGGITDLDQIEQLFSIGCEKIAINTATYTNMDLVREAASHFGSQSIVAAVDVRRRLLGKLQVVSHCGQQIESVQLLDHLRRLQDHGCGEILLNSIDRDGTMKGYDLELIRTACATVEVPLIACGGAGSLEDLRQALVAGASAVAAGSFFVFHGKHRAVLITYPSRSDLEQLFSTI